ncbi:MAG: PQQ-binding-like beta-propeller repeat protein [Candidatus Lernaella stagnicola]|nr:PQQ-binding-like beta-propeller repeat protein [Candidatus Lernaella stagnicola]
MSNFTAYSRCLWLVVCLVALLTGSATADDESVRQLTPRLQIDVGEPLVDAVSAHGRLFAATADELHAFDPASGRAIWRRRIPNLQSLAVGAHRVWAAAKGSLRQYRIEDGTPILVTETEGDHMMLAPEPVARRLAAQVDGSSVIMRAGDHEILLRHAEPLFPSRWEIFARQTGFWRARLDENNERIFFVAGRRLTAASLQTGAVLYEKSLRHAAVGWPTYLDGSLYFFGANRFFCVDADNGKIRFVSRLNTPRPPVPVVVARQESTQRVWYERLWYWGRRVMGLSRTYVVLRYKNGLAFHYRERDETRLFHPMPGDPLPLFDDGASVFWLMRFKDEVDGIEKSALMRMSKYGNQCYGRAEFAGTASGLHVLSRQRVYAEMAPGRLVSFGIVDLRPRALYDFGDRLIALTQTGGFIVAAAANGRIAVFNRR